MMEQSNYLKLGGLSMNHVSLGVSSSDKIYLVSCVNFIFICYTG